MKGNIQKLTRKGKPKTEKEKVMTYVKSVRKADRELAKESGEFHAWIPKTRVHTDKKKKADKNNCKNFKYKKEKE